MKNVNYSLSILDRSIKFLSSFENRTHCTMVFVWVSSGIINGILFFCVDIVCLWAIHRGLLALQGYYIQRLARGGRRISISRSRVPVISGELVNVGTRFNFLFVIFYAGILVMAFVATLEVNGLSKSRYLPVNRSHITTLSSVGKLEEDEVNMLYSLSGNASSCFQRNSSHLSYWPVAFNIDKNSEKPIDMSCQFGAPNFSPLIQIECVSQKNETCSLGRLYRNTFVDIELHQRGEFTSMWNDTIVEYFVSVIRTTDIKLVGLQGYLFIYGLEPFRKEGYQAVLFLINSVTQETFFGLGIFTNRTKYSVSIPPPVHINPPSLLYKDSELVNLLQNGIARDSLAIMFYSTTSFIEHVTNIALRVKTHEDNSFSLKTSEGTEISRSSIVIFVIIIGFGFLLCFMKEILQAVIRKSRSSFMQLNFNEFDALSIYLRREIEKQHDMELSGGYAVLGIVENRDGEARIEPVKP